MPRCDIAGKDPSGFRTVTRPCGLWHVEQLNPLGPSNLMGAGKLLKLTSVAVAAVARARLIDRHRDAGVGMWVVTVRAANIGQVVLGAVPLVHVGTIMTLQAEIFASLVTYVAVRIVTGRAFECSRVV